MLSPKNILCLLALVSILPACGKSSASGDAGAAVASSVAITTNTSGYNFSTCVAEFGQTSGLCAIPKTQTGSFNGGGAIGTYSSANLSVQAGDTLIIKSPSHISLVINSQVTPLSDNTTAKVQAPQAGAVGILYTGNWPSYNNILVYTCIDSNNNVQLCP